MQRLLLQLDGDRQPSVFDAVVALDAGAEQLLRHAPVGPGDVRGLVHGAIFTRGPKDLHNTGIFIGGSDVPQAERLLEEARASFFGPFRTSILFDPNGSNTTAAAAVVKLVQAAGGDVTGMQVVVLAGTGPVGTRAAGLFVRQGARVRITSRGHGHAQSAARQIRERFGGEVETVVVDVADGANGAHGLDEALEGVQVLFAAGPAGVQLAKRGSWAGRPGLLAAADANAVPPMGIEGIEVGDDGVEREGVAVYGALGIGGLKMRIHKACVRRLFEQNDLVFDAETIFDLALALEGAGTIPAAR